MSDQETGTPKVVDIGGLTEELLLAGLPAAGVDSNGRITWTSGASGQEKLRGAQIAARHGGKCARAEQRRAAGITVEAMVAALWEKVFLGKDDQAQALLQKMAVIEMVE